MLFMVVVLPSSLLGSVIGMLIGHALCSIRKALCK